MPNNSRALIGIIAALSVLNARQITKPYSFWLDELATVSLFQSPHSGLWKYLMADNFPPLYFLLLKPWVFIFGLSEVSLHMMSWLCVASAISAMGWFVLSIERRGQAWAIVAAGLMGTLPTVAYAGQEARPYALMLFLSTLVATSAVAVIKGDPQPKFPFNETTFILSSLLLSLTHYFGLILALLITVANMLLLRPAQKLRNLILALTLLVWPFIHAVYGRLLTQTGGNFWIQVQPITGTLKVLLITCPFLLLLFPLLLLLLLNVRQQRLREPDQFLCRSLTFLGMILLGFLLLMLLGDLHTPLSIPRYYVAIIPVAVLFVVELSMLVFQSFRLPWLKKSFAFLLAILILAQGVKAQHRIERKSTPDQDWKTLAAVVRKTSICAEGCDALGYSAWGDYYFHGLNINNLDPKASNAYNSFIVNRPLLGFHRASSLLAGLQQANPNLICLEPRQAIAGSTFLVFDKAQIPKEVKFDLLPCQIQPRS